MKAQKIKRDKTKPSGPTVVDQRTPRAPATIQIDPKYANAPVRCVNFVEVKDMDPKQVQLMIQELGAIHDSARGGIHYFIPVRFGKIGSDVVFEEEWLRVVRETCEVNEDGEIVLKGGAKEMLVIREKI
jgi:hypothetical protein